MTSDPVGIPEIAQRLGVSRYTVDSWRQRDVGFPEPTWTIGGGPAWDWPVIKEWSEWAKLPRKREPRDGTSSGE